MNKQYTFKELLIAANQLGECSVEERDLNYLQMLHDQELAALRARVAELDKLVSHYQLKADMFDYLGWVENTRLPEELRKAQFLQLASDGTTCWSETWADAVRVAMEHDKEIYVRAAIDAAKEPKP